MTEPGSEHTEGIDYYGPFLEPEDIKYKPDPDVPEVVLKLGEQTLQAGEMKPTLVTRHARFILNVLLSREDGSIHGNRLLEMGFYPETNIYNRRQHIRNNAIRLAGLKFAPRQGIISRSKDDTHPRKPYIFTLYPGFKIVHVDEASLQSVKQDVSEPAQRETIPPATPEELADAQLRIDDMTRRGYSWGFARSVVDPDR